MPALQHNQFAAPAKCPVVFWRFAVPLALGNLAGIGTSYVARRLTANEHPTTTKTVSVIGGIVGFWAVAGVTWVLLNRNGTPA